MKLSHDYFDDNGPQSRTEVGGRRILCKGGGGGSSTTVQSIPEELKPLAKTYSTKAIDISNQPYTPYTEQRYADLNPVQMAGVQMAQNRALSGSDVMDTGKTYLKSVMSEGYGPSTYSNPYLGASMSVGANAYAGANPYLENAIDRSLGDVQTRVNSQFGGNNYGTTAHQETLARALGDTSSAMRMQDYGTQQQLAEAALDRSLGAQQADLARNSGLAEAYANRGLQGYQIGQDTKLHAAQLAPAYGGAAYQDAAQLMNAGQILQDQTQQGRDFAYEQFQEQQNDPYKRLAAMSGVFGSNLGSSSTTQQSGGGGK